MASVPRATVTVEPTSAAPGSGADLVCVLSPCKTSPDMVPRLFGSAQAVYEQHDYCEGVEYAAKHIAQTGKSILFVGMPIGTAGAISRSTGHENTGTSVVSVTAGGDGVLAEHDGILRCLAGGTIGTDQIKLELSLDGGRSFSPVRLGTATSYALPYVNATLAFAAGTLVAGDTVLEWHGSAPRIDTSDLAEVRAALASGDNLFRSILIAGDMTLKASVDAVVTQMNAYATANDRFAFARCSVGPDRFPQASLSQEYWRVTGTPTLTFATAADTVTRSAGSWIADGAQVGDSVTFEGSASNDITTTIVSVDSATQITVAANLTNEGPVSNVSVTGGPTLVFAASGDTVTRNRGSWLVDGFRPADSVTIAGTASNNTTLAAVTVTALVLTLANGLADETIAASEVTVVAGTTKAAWMAALDATFAGVDGQPRVDLSAGRGAETSLFSGWSRRIPAAWFASAREYAHDLHVATWRKDLGPVGADLFDVNNQLVEWDDRVDGGAGSAAGFTTLRTWANGPRGGFITQSLTRAGDGQIASKTHNAAVINEACNVVQQATENVIGRSLILNDDGTATKDSLAVIAAEVNAALQLSLLQSRGEGPRASSAVWTPDPTDVYSVAEPVMHGSLRLNLNGTIHSVDTSVRVATSGQ